MRTPGVRLEGRYYSPVAHDPVGRESLCWSHLRRLEVGKVGRLLERERVRETRCQDLIERQRIEGLFFRGYVDAVVDRNLVVLVDEVIAVDTVDGYGSGGIYGSRSHSAKLLSWCDGGGVKDASGLGRRRK